MKESAAKGGGGSARARGGRKVLLFQHYWHRVLGTALGWFAWDFYYCERSSRPLSATADASLAPITWHHSVNVYD